MRRPLRTLRCRAALRALACVSLAAVALGAAGPAEASDHEDTAVLSGEASLDIADVFAWTNTSTEASHVYLAMTLRGRPVPGVQYVFHLDNRGTFDGASTESVALCTFDVSLTVQCWLRNEAYVVGDASEGLVGFDLAAWTTFVDDPAFADRVGLRDFVQRLGATQASPDDAACPDLTADARQGLLDDLAAATRDDFVGERVFLILLRAPTAVAAPGGALLGVWASVRGATP